MMADRGEEFKENGESREPGWQDKAAERQRETEFTKHRRGWTRSVVYELGYAFVAIQAFLLFLALNFSSGNTWQ
jgi:hypothetical protein